MRIGYRNMDTKSLIVALRQKPMPAHYYFGYQFEKYKWHYDPVCIQCTECVNKAKLQQIFKVIIQTLGGNVNWDYFVFYIDSNWNKSYILSLPVKIVFTYHLRLKSEPVRTDFNLFLNLPDATSDVLIQDLITVKDAVYALGSDSDGKLVKSLLKTKTKLYVWVYDKTDIWPLINLKYYNENVEFKFYDIKMSTFKNCALETLFDKRDQYTLCSVSTNSFKDTMQLHHLLMSSFPFSQSIKTTSNWTIELMCTLDYMVHFNKYPSHLYWNMVDYNERIIVERKKNNIEQLIVSFDIETISIYDKRIPTGEDCFDMIFSCVFSVKTPNSNDIIIYSFLNTGTVNYEFIKERYKNYDESGKYTRIVEFFKTEQELLHRIINFLITISDGRRYLLIGYNINAYDIPFIINRCVLYNMTEYYHLFHQHKQVSYIGIFMEPIDVYLLIKKYFEVDGNKLKSYSLNEVCKIVLESENKVDVSAVDIRFVYRSMLSPADTLTFYGYYYPKIVYYNEMDTILVFSIWDKLQLNNYLTFICKEFFIHPQRWLCGKMNESLCNRILISALKSNNVITNVHNKTAKITNDGFCKDVDYNVYISENADSTFSGGFNYRFSKDVFAKTCAFDFITYYPKIIEHFNISPENVAILNFNQLYQLKHILSNIEDKILIYLYNEHKERGYLYINGVLDCGSQVNLNCILSNCEFYKSKRFVLILTAAYKKGILSISMEEMNVCRAKLKEQRKLCESRMEKYKKSQQEKYEQYKNMYFMINLSFRLYKILNSSVYGFLGSDFSVIKSKICAAIVTFLGRNCLINTAKRMISLNFNPVLMDTDSIFIGSDNCFDLPVHNENITYNMKIYDDVFIIRKKTYFYRSEGSVSAKGIIKNCTPLFLDVLYEQLYTELIIFSKDVYLRDVPSIFSRLVAYVEDKLKEDFTLAFNQIQIKDSPSDYKTNTPAKLLMEKVLSRNPQYKFGSKLTYFPIKSSNIKTCIWELDTYANDYSYKDVNYYVYLSSIKSAIYEIIIQSITLTYLKNHNIKYRVDSNILDKLLVSACNK